MIGTDPSVCFPIPQQILPAKEHKINKQIVMFQNNQRNSRPFLTLKVGHRHLYNEGDFQWRGSQQSCDSTPFVI
jgi:hypothetical protein